jgi:hypothetical protein
MGEESDQDDDEDNGEEVEEEDLDIAGEIDPDSPPVSRNFGCFYLRVLFISNWSSQKKYN